MGVRERRFGFLQISEERMVTNEEYRRVGTRDQLGVVGVVGWFISRRLQNIAFVYVTMQPQKYVLVFL